ncbi:hypothetical protein FPOAC2_09824 [Fusarium poae]|uniref:hypothetical protein n=1 Tax=Fusarium poae TaxID=36050 RepID=UPI001CE743A2|nr:hypothetical protein FPOAC1_009875 [Fusarium poae]KAG8670459.1 hypothetical protein FPOAC1_009875 [Fusarium poae]
MEQQNQSKDIVQLPKPQLEKISPAVHMRNERVNLQTRQRWAIASLRNLLNGATDDANVRQIFDTEMSRVDANRGQDLIQAIREQAPGSALCRLVEAGSTVGQTELVTLD